MIDTYERKRDLVRDLDNTLAPYFPDIKWISYFAYQKIGKEHLEEFIVLEWTSGGKSYANNNCNSLSATARNVTRMLDGGVYENIDYYESIIESKEWIKIV